MIISPLRNNLLGSWGVSASWLSTFWSQAWFRVNWFLFEWANCRYVGGFYCLKCLWTSLSMIQCSSEKPEASMSLRFSARVSFNWNLVYRKECPANMFYQEGPQTCCTVGCESVTWQPLLHLHFRARWCLTLRVPGWQWPSSSNCKVKRTSPPESSHCSQRATINVTDRFFWWSIDCWTAWQPSVCCNCTCWNTATPGWPLIGHTPLFHMTSYLLPAA